MAYLELSNSTPASTPTSGVRHYPDNSLSSSPLVFRSAHAVGIPGSWSWVWACREQEAEFEDGFRWASGWEDSRNIGQFQDDEMVEMDRITWKTAFEGKMNVTHQVLVYSFACFEQKSGCRQGLFWVGCGMDQ